MSTQSLVNVRPPSRACTPLLLAWFPLMLGAEVPGAQAPEKKKDSEEKPTLCGEPNPEYAATEQPALLDIGSANYLAITGKGEPGGEAFQKNVGLLYRAAYSIKMRSMSAGQDYPVCMLQGQWWGSGKKRDFFNEPRDTWNWKLLIRVPDFITKKHVSDAFPAPSEPGKEAGIEALKLETLTEGRCVQALHIGPYATEPKTIAKMMAFAKEQGVTPHGRHHEIYLSDPSTTKPEELRTILRQPVK